jgi:CBS domain-containing protein
MAGARMGPLPVVDREQHLVGMVSRADLVPSEIERD